MDFAAILQMIMTIIQMIMQLIGGGTFTKVLKDTDPPVQMAYYECASPKWEKAAQVKDNVFSGTVALTCEIQGNGGKGLVGLRQHMIAQIPQSVSSVGAGPHIVSYEGLPSNRFDVAVEVENGSENSKLKGVTHIATDGFTRLRNVFTSTSAPGGDAKYLKQVSNEIDVSPAERDGFYKVTMRYSSEVTRPWFVNSMSFYKALIKKHEETLNEKKEHVLNDLAANL